LFLHFSLKSKLLQRLKFKYGNNRKGSFQPQAGYLALFVVLDEVLSIKF
jgi:hypothetical protein